MGDDDAIEHGEEEVINKDNYRPIVFKAHLAAPIHPSGNAEYPYTSGSTPLTHKEAMQHKSIWQPAMEKEHDGLQAINAWTLVPKDKEMNIIGCKWAYTRKFNEESNWKPKARLVAKGFQQIPGIDFFETHVSVV
jgi:Reverse transcriptase (RNA-dependent DNA polymerase)